MYFPYLRGKQFELMALRDFSNDNQGNNKIIPIIEPVKQQMNGMNTALSVMIENGMKFAIILNPSDGDFKHENIDNDILKQLPQIIDKRTQWIPAYTYKNNSERLLEHASLNGLDDLMIVLPKGVDVTDERLMSFLSNETVRYIVFANSGARSVRPRLLKLDKHIISLKDRFNSRTRNADYELVNDEFFSDDFAFYSADGLYGFSDYTTIGKDFVEGGMLPYAIAIHLTYKKTEEEIYVHHFVSENNYDQSNIKGKFHEAAQKIEPFYNGCDIVHTSAVDELIEKSKSDDGYPGLGYLKKLSVKNHLELINRILPE